MAEKIMKLTVTAQGRIRSKPHRVTLSIQRQDSVLWVSKGRFRVLGLTRKKGKRGPRGGPFFRPFPAPGEGYSHRVSSGPPRPGTAKAVYKTTFQFSNHKKYDPIIIIDQ